MDERRKKDGPEQPTRAAASSSADIAPSPRTATWREAAQRAASHASGITINDDPQFVGPHAVGRQGEHRTVYTGPYADGNALYRAGLRGLEVAASVERDVEAGKLPKVAEVPVTIPGFTGSR